jgi:hypothetical protein
MTLVNILVFIAFTLLVRWLCPRHWRGWFVLVGSLLAVFWLQPSTPIRNLDFWLPAASIALTILTWAIIRPAETSSRVPWVTGMLLIAGSFLAVGLLRYIPGLCCLTPSRPPQLIQILQLLLSSMSCLRWSTGSPPAGAGFQPSRSDCL